MSISDGTYTTSYAYDSANQLIRENNQQLGFTQTWEYDNGGNITFRRKYAYTTGNLENLVPTDVVSYGYSTSDLGDLLVEYDGTEITHDAIGNPLYDGQWTYTWEHGRELSAMSDGGYSNWTFTYDAGGMRTQRTDGYYTYSYIYNGSQLSQLTVVYDDGEHYEYHRLNFAYSADGTPLTVTYGGCTYYYVTNIQGDVIAILDDIGRLVCRYAYDAWGNVTICDERPDNVSWYNPLRYYQTTKAVYLLVDRLLFPNFACISEKKQAYSPAFRQSYGCGKKRCFLRKTSLSEETKHTKVMQKKERKAMKNNNQINVPQAREAMDRFKMQAASEVGVNLTNGYNGHLTSREAGSVGGQMVKKMIEAYEQGMQ